MVKLQLINILAFSKFQGKYPIHCLPKTLDSRLRRNDKYLIRYFTHDTTIAFQPWILSVIFFNYANIPVIPFRHDISSCR